MSKSTDKFKAKKKHISNNNITNQTRNKGIWSMSIHSQSVDTFGALFGHFSFSKTRVYLPLDLNMSTMNYASENIIQYF